MNLHLDPDAFAELVTAAANELRIPPGIIEKDYYVSLVLRELSRRCDYYLSDKVERHSRHLYDIFKILEFMTPDSSFPKLVQEVRRMREPLLICPSAKQDICINALLREIVENEVYRNDYETITRKLLFTYIPYEKVIGGIERVMQTGFFI